MIGITNVGGGGGMAYAYIGVVYDAGATVTCTDGNKTYRAKDTSGLYVFPVPYAATWIVTATDGTSTRSESVVITSLWQDVVVTMSFRDGTFWDGTLYYDGNDYAEYTGGWAKTLAMTRSYRYSQYSNNGSVSFDQRINLSVSKTYSCAIAQTMQTIDLTGFDSITIKPNYNDAGTERFSYIIIRDSDTGYYNQNYLKMYSVLGTDEQTFSLSDVNESAFIFVACETGNSTQMNMNVDRIKLNRA